MSVYKPKKSPFYQYDFWISGVRFSGSTQRAGKSEARKIEAQKRDKAKLEIERQRVQGHGPMTMGIAAGRYWQEVGKHHVNAATTLTDLNRLVTFFTSRRILAEIGDSDVAKLVTWRRGQNAANRKMNPRPVAPATVNRSTTGLLQKIFNRAATVLKVALPDPPTWRRHLLKEPNERVREVRAHEEEALAAIGADYLPIVSFSRASGLRMAGCILRKADVDLFAGVVSTIGKGGKQIAQPITAEMRAILMAEMANPTAYVFTYAAKRAIVGKRGRGDRIPITISGLKTAWRRARATGLPTDLRFHDMRHDFATKLLRETGNLKLVQKALHHSKVETTVRYAHVLDEEVLQGMEASSRARQQALGVKVTDRSPEKITEPR